MFALFLNFIQKIFATKFAIFGTGIALKEAINWPFDYLLYPFVITWQGEALGWAIMIVLSIIFDLFLIRGYDWSKTDWLLIETLKKHRMRPAKTRWGKMLQWLMNKSDIATFIFLCVHENPATVVIYFRKGAFRYNGMSARDWKFFFGAVLVANIVWLLVVTGVIRLVKSLYA